MSDKTEVNKTLLVVLAVHTLGGEADLETIAVKAHELFPQEFCWRSYPQFPDKEVVRVHLSEAKKKSFGALVTDQDLRHGRTNAGGYVKRFALTKAGSERAVELLKSVRLDGIAASQNPIEYKRLVEPIIESDAYKQYVSGAGLDKIGRDEFLLAFKLFADASPFVITGRLSRAEATIARLPRSRDQDTLRSFVQEGRHAFGL